jgi:hypothetical protein
MVALLFGDYTVLLGSGLQTRTTNTTTTDNFPRRHT